jgi:class 3 adenylate cyclase
MVGGSIVLDDKFEKNSAEIRCEKEGGFSTALSHTPFVSTYFDGLLLHFWRTLVELVIGPVFSLLLIIYLFGSNRKLKEYGYSPYITFSIVMFFYTISLAGYPRLILAGLPASVTHATLRTLLAWSFFRLCSYFSRPRKFIELGLFALVLTFPTVGILQPTSFEIYYDRILPIFSLVMLTSIIDLSRNKVNTRAGFYLREVSLLWLFVLLSDLITVYVNFGSYPAPVLSAFITVLVLMLKIHSDKLDQLIETVSSKVWLILESTSSVDQKLATLTGLISKYMSFPASSAYLDAYILGMHDVPNKKFIEIYSSGDGPFSADKKVIVFDEGFGNQMRQALEQGNPQLKLSSLDNKWYVNLPLGDHAIMNFTGLDKHCSLLGSEGLELCARVYPALQSINHQLTEFAARMAFDLETLRLIKGDGSWSEHLGMIFIDINHFSDNCEKYKDPYALFVTQLYFPAMCQRVRKWAVREGSTKGDGAYLLCIKELMQENCTIPEAVYNVVLELMKFVRNEGADICVSQGYDPIKVQIGANAGIATVICDAFQVRTIGNLVTETARLQQSAPPGGTLVHMNLIDQWPKQGDLRYSSEQREIVKTKRLRACQVFLEFGNNEKQSN